MWTNRHAGIDSKKLSFKMVSKSGKAPVPDTLDEIPLEASGSPAVRKAAQNATVV